MDPGRARGAREEGREGGGLGEEGREGVAFCSRALSVLTARIISSHNMEK